jgi:hypothetical protein
MVDVETAGMVTGVGGFLVTATQYFVPANVNYTGSLSMGFLTMVAGWAVWWRTRRDRRRQESDEDRQSG